VNLSAKKHQRLLHVHHRDNNPKNNWNYNLIALCVICHSEQPGAGHKRLAGAITKDGRRREVEWLR
jgi:5-methylcytosine-specific restriction endonuclease McrA